MAEMKHGEERLPVPDPSVLTTQQSQAAILCLREIIEARLDGVDERFLQLRVEFERVPSEVKMALERLQDYNTGQLSGLANHHLEKFASIDKQFVERDTRIDKTAELNQKAIDAALQAAEKAVGKQNESFAVATTKSEAATTKQIDQMVRLNETTNNGMTDKIDDLKSRLMLIEGKGIGMASVWAFIVGAVGVVLGVAGLVLAIKH